MRKKKRLEAPEVDLNAALFEKIALTHVVEASIALEGPWEVRATTPVTVGAMWHEMLV